MSQGVLFDLVIDGRTMPFKRIDVDIVAGEIDTSSKLNPDGSVNIGYTSSSGDLGTIVISFYELLGDNNAMDDVAFFNVGVRYAASWSVGYAGVTLYSGDAFYYIGSRLSGSVPGEGGCDFRLKSNGPWAQN